MSTWTIALQELRVGLRNRWVLATTVLLAALALSLSLLGSAPTGVVKADRLAVVAVSLASLTIFLVPLIALLLSFDSVVGELERGTLLVLLAGPVRRWQVVIGKALGHTLILAGATAVGYGVAAAVLWREGGDAQGLRAFAAMVGSSMLLGAVFVALGTLASTLVRERATAAGLAIGAWLLFVLVYDSALLGWLVADQGRSLGPAGLDALLLLNPTDAYRLLATAGTDGAAAYGALAGPGGGSGLSSAACLAALLAWIAAPLALAVLVFRRSAP